MMKLPKFTKTEKIQEKDLEKSQKFNDKNKLETVYENLLKMSKYDNLEENGIPLEKCLEMTPLEVILFAMATKLNKGQVVAAAELASSALPYIHSKQPIISNGEEGVSNNIYIHGGLPSKNKDITIINSKEESCKDFILNITEEEENQEGDNLQIE